MKEGDDPRESALARRRPTPKRRRRRKRWLRVSPPIMFYATVLLAAPSFALAYLRGERFLALSVGASLLVLAVLVINERSGFVRSRRIRRPYDTRDKFNKLEVAVLFALLMGGLFVSVSAWLT